MAKIQDVMLGKTMRKSFAKHDKILAIPNMLKIQKDSYNWFLDEGLREVFRDVDTITDYTGNLELSFLDYSMNEPPKYTVEECKERLLPYYAKFGFVNEGVSGSTHGGVTWYQMRLTF